MRTSGRARFAALSVLAAAAGAVALLLAVLAHAGFHVCAHQLTAAQHAGHDVALAGGATGVELAADAEEGVCPIVLYCAAVAAALALLSILTLAASRATAPAALLAAARAVDRVRLAPLTGLLALAGLAPLAAILAGEGLPSGLPALAALAALLTGAFLGAVAIGGSARVVLAFARRVAVAIAAAFELLVPGEGARWSLGPEPLLVAAGVRCARRRPSRAPPPLRS
ncbi:MAG TPA: hypothetical protein VGD01_12200 [Candidatus Elarobacter sp.]|jgi:hypothetical protein